jgi:hypothetical protein
MMVMRADVVGVELAAASSGAADLTGPAPGPAIEITLRQPLTVVLAGTPRAPRGRALHARAVLVAPSRPGRALREAAAQL